MPRDESGEDSWAPFLHPDPSFPDRPSHRDFDWLSAIVIDLDAEAEAMPEGATIEDIAKRYVDPTSLSYMALQRAIRSLGVTTGAEVLEHTSEVFRLSAMYYEGFLIGLRFERQRAKRDRKSGNPGKRSQ